MRPTSCILFLLALCVQSFAADPVKPETEFEQWGSYNPSYQFVFFATLEGLYIDGVPNDVVDAVIPLSEKGFRALTEHFVYACPLCAPVKDAFNIYRVRLPFAHQKPLRFEPSSEGHPVPVYRDTFGKGLNPDETKALKSPDKKVRLTALQALVQKWVRRRMESLRLSPAEKKEWDAKFEAMNKDGANFLKEWIAGGDRAAGMGFDYRGWTDNCPSCSGVVKNFQMVAP